MMKRSRVTVGDFIATHENIGRIVKVSMFGPHKKFHVKSPGGKAFLAKEKDIMRVIKRRR